MYSAIELLGNGAIKTAYYYSLLFYFYYFRVGVMSLVNIADEFISRFRFREHGGLLLHGRKRVGKVSKTVFNDFYLERNNLNHLDNIASNREPFLHQEA